jgi:Na+-driven multidrug efflux pump
MLYSFLPVLENLGFMFVSLSGHMTEGDFHTMMVIYFKANYLNIVNSYLLMTTFHWQKSTITTLT